MLRIHLVGNRGQNAFVEFLRRLPNPGLVHPDGQLEGVGESMSSAGFSPPSIAGYSNAYSKSPFGAVTAMRVAARPSIVGVREARC